MSTLRRYTSAPREADGFGTTTAGVVGAVLEGIEAGRAIRAVDVQADHQAWQESRYRSGLCFAWDEAELLAAEKDGIIRLEVGRVADLT